MVDGLSRKEGERVRLWHAIERLRTTLESLEQALTTTHPIGNDVAQAVTMTAQEIAMQIAKYDAFDLAEQDAAAPHKNGAGR